MSKHNHYFKDVSHLSVIDVYRTLILFGVTDPCIQHAAKKLLVAGARGAGKDISQDIQEAIDSLERWKQMRVEENPIYNRRSEDKVKLIDLPDVPLHPEVEAISNRSTGKFKEGDKVRIFNVTDSCIPEEFEGVKGVVKAQFDSYYEVQFDKKYKDNPNPLWCVRENQMELVESKPYQFGD